MPGSTSRGRRPQIRSVASMIEAKAPSIRTMLGAIATVPLRARADVSFGHGLQGRVGRARLELGPAWVGDAPPVLLMVGGPVRV